MGSTNPISLRVLHLLEPDAGEDALIACRAAAAIEGAEHASWVIGGTGAERRAAESGVRTVDRIGAPGGRAELAWRGARALRGDRERAGWRPDIVQCWSIGTLGLARLVFGRSTPRVGMVFRVPDRTRQSPLDRVRERWAIGGGGGGAGGATVVTPSEAAWRAWSLAGAADVRMAPPPVGPVLDPAVEAARVRRREEIIARLGLGSDGRRWTLVALLADPPSRGDARGLAFMLGLLHTSGQRVAGVVPRGCGGVRRAARFIRVHGRQWGLLEWDGPMELAAAACDLAVWDEAGGDAGAVLAARCAAAGVPVVSDDGELPRRLLGSAAEVCITAQEGLAAMSARLLPLVENEALRRRTGAALASGVRERAGAESFESVLGEIWREAARVPVTQPPAPAAEATARGERRVVSGALA